MKQFAAKIQSIQQLTHDVLRIETEKPNNYSFVCLDNEFGQKTIMM